ncbi:MAG TPA: MFS transporter [Bradyrhizobium sp.]|uniref:MFS transporter n=1 Tax=Bradyrhizobium sp. TaxID=376 RepID=UPI002B6CCE3D|nr:MFS transporter [Bradyrhizobium sp.]HTB04603.1 MFS transporter [Bradyrhizobium sp.]
MRAWAVVAMMFLFMLINFADKAVIGLAAVPIIADLHLTNEQFGQVGSAFFLFFSISAVLIGFLVNRVSTKWVLTAMALIWAFTQLPMLGVVSLPILFASRIVLGAGEGPAYPVALHAVYKWFANERRTLPTSLVAIGGAIGAGVVAPLLTWVILTFSWHAAFGFLGIVGLVWVAVWMIVGKEGPLDTHQTEAGGGGLTHVPYATLLTSRTAIGVFIAGFSAYWALTLAVVWLPAFLVKAAGYTPTQTGWIVTLPSLLQMVLSPIVGYVSQRLLLTGTTSRVSRGLLGGGCVAGAGLAMILLSKSTGSYEQIPLVAVTFAIGSLIYTLGPALIGEISPVRQRGAMLGISNAIYTLAGLAAPWLMGHIIDIGANPAEGFRSGFELGGSIILVGGLLAMVLINPERDLERFRQTGVTAAGLRASPPAAQA